MTRKDVRTVFLVAIVIFMMGVIVGMCLQIIDVSAQEVSADEVMAYGDRALIEGGGMPCMADHDEVKETIPEVEVSSVPVYLVDGHRLGEDLEKYLYKQLEDRGVEFFYPTALCQIYQESRFDPYAVNKNGLDMGLCQFRITYFPRFAMEAGLYQYDVMNPIDSLYVYAYLMSKYIAETGDVYSALSRYYTGGGAYNAQYVNDVLQWSYKMEVNDG